MDAMYEARGKGADIVKVWDATLDGKTRSAHRAADGQIRELDEYFEVGGEKMTAPGIDGSAANVCNCRCQVLQMSRHKATKGRVMKMDNFSKEMKYFEAPQNYDEFKKAYWSDDNMKYMKYVADKEKKYGTKNFKKVLSAMSEKEYATYRELLDKTPMYKNGVEKSAGTAIMKMDLMFFSRNVKDYNTVVLSKNEYAHVMSELNTNLSDEQRKKKVITKAIGDFCYTIENNGFNNYRIIGKTPIDANVEGWWSNQ